MKIAIRKDTEEFCTILLFQILKPPQQYIKYLMHNLFKHLQ
jgi:hypothetical protein